MIYNTIKANENLKNEMNNLLSQMGNYIELSEWYSDTANSTYTVSLGDITKYKYILMTAKYGNYIRCSHLIPTIFLANICRYYYFSYTNGSTVSSMGELTFSGTLQDMSVTYTALQPYAPIMITGIY